LLKQQFLLRIDCSYAKSIIEKDVKNLTSKQFFALSVLDFIIDYIRGTANSLPDFLTRKFLQGTIVPG